MRPVIKERRECSGPPFGSFRNRFPSASLWCWGVHVGTSTPSCFRVFRTLTTPYACVLSRRPLRLVLRVRLPFTPLPAVRCRPPLRTPWVDASEMSSSRRRTVAAPIPASWPATALHLSTAHPHIVRIRKKGGVSASLRGVNSYASNPATTVSSVEESNAFAASVTGRYAKRTD